MHLRSSRSFTLSRGLTARRRRISRRVDDIVKVELVVGDEAGGPLALVLKVVNELGFV